MRLLWIFLAVGFALVSMEGLRTLEEISRHDPALPARRVNYIAAACSVEAVLIWLACRKGKRRA